MKLLVLSNNDNTKSFCSKLAHEYSNEVILYTNKLTLEYLKELKPDRILSYNYRHIISGDVIEGFERGIINLHISYLPWNRGAFPNFWSIVNNSPKGVTIHFIDKGIDTGNIICQKEAVFNEEKETLESSYNLLHKAIQQLFFDNYSDIIYNKTGGTPQTGKGSLYTIKDFKKIEALIGGVDWKMSISDFRALINTKRLGE